MMKIVDCVLAGVREVIEEDRNLDKVLAYWIKENREEWGENDVATYNEVLNDVVRWWRLLNSLANAVGVGGGNPTIGALTVYQELNKNVSIIREKLTARQHKKLEFEYSRLQETRAIRESIPDWLDKLCAQELGLDWDSTIAALNSFPNIVIRANRLKTDRRSLMAILKNEGFYVGTMELPDAIVFKQRCNIFRSSAFRQGYFEQQDLSSQRVAEFMQLEPGQRVIDACAGNGGKTLNIASLMGNKGKIIAMDIFDVKLDELKRRAKRAGCTIVEPRYIDSTKVVKRLHENCDRLLLDVPCSGLGVLRRNPDAKWHLSLEGIWSMQQTQREILTHYCPMAKVGGKVIYTTCSILPSENQKQVQWFLSQNEGKYQLEEEQAISPVGGHDGFYMARLVRLS